MVNYNIQSKRAKKAEVVVGNRLVLPTGLIREIRIWKIAKGDRYPDGFRYRLVLVDPKTGSVLLLFDNHWPKGHHVHIGDDERPYEFTGVEDLVREFLKRVASIQRSRK